MHALWGQHLVALPDIDAIPDSAPMIFVVRAFGKGLPDYEFSTMSPMTRVKNLTSKVPVIPFKSSCGNPVPAGMR